MSQTGTLNSVIEARGAMRFYYRTIRILSGALWILLFMSLPGRVWAQTPKFCDFWGTASIRGVAITSANTVRAYDPRGQLCRGGVGQHHGGILLHQRGQCL